MKHSESVSTRSCRSLQTGTGVFFPAPARLKIYRNFTDSLLVLQLLTFDLLLHVSYCMYRVSLLSSV